MVGIFCPRHLNPIPVCGRCFGEHVEAEVDRLTKGIEALKTNFDLERVLLLELAEAAGFDREYVPDHECSADCKRNAGSVCGIWRRVRARISKTPLNLERKESK